LTYEVIADAGTDPGDVVKHLFVVKLTIVAFFQEKPYLEHYNK